MLSCDPDEDRNPRLRADLRRCLENTMVDEELYSEAKFLQVKGLLTGSQVALRRIAAGRIM